MSELRNKGFVSLVQNAIEASPADAEVLVRLRSDDDGGAIIDVYDDGIGLDPDIAARLFSPGATSKPDGSGLGLAIARGIVHEHGGSLTLTTRHDRAGCHARVWLPSEPPTASDEPSHGVTLAPGESVPESRP